MLPNTQKPSKTVSAVRRLCIFSTLSTLLFVSALIGYNAFYEARRDAMVSQNSDKGVMTIASFEVIYGESAEGPQHTDSTNGAELRRRLAADYGCMEPYATPTPVVSTDVTSKLTSSTTYIGTTEAEILAYFDGSAVSVEITDAWLTQSKFRFNAVKNGQNVACYVTLDGTGPSCTATEVEENCFDADSMVYRLKNKDDESMGYDVVPIKEIEIDDMVMTDLNGKFGKVIYRMHYLQRYFNARGTVREVCFGEGDKCVRVSPDHLVFVNGTELDNLVNAGSLKVGDVMFTIGDAAEADKAQRVTSIKEDVKTSIRNVVTEDGTIIVNDMYFSCLVGKNKYDHLVFFKITEFMYWLAHSVLKDNLVFVFGVDMRTLWRDDLFSYELSDRIVTFWNLFGRPLSKTVNKIGATSGTVIVSILACVLVRFVKKN